MVDVTRVAIIDSSGKIVHVSSVFSNNQLLMIKQKYKGFDVVIISEQYYHHISKELYKKKCIKLDKFIRGDKNG